MAGGCRYVKTDRVFEIDFSTRRDWVTTSWAPVEMAPLE